jgi:UDP-N-acetylmuramoylalanine--D-glutamate ligase
VYVTDAGTGAPVLSAASELQNMGISSETGRHSMDRFLSADEIVVSPGVPLDISPLEAARRKGIPILSELELAFRYLKGEIVAVTGSNGKTTTTTLVGELLKPSGRPVQVGGNIGTAMTGLIETSTPQTINVVEVSSFQLDGIHRFRPRVAVLLNITPDHLDRYSGFAAYRASKFRVFANQDAGDVAVLNRDDPQVYPPPSPLRGRTKTFSQKVRVDDGAFREGGDLYLDGKPVMPVSDVRLRGAHNIDNVLASMVTAVSYGVSPDAISGVVREFQGVEHRIEYVATVKGVQFFNDSKATNVDSAVKAVESFEGGIILILGGKDKGASYQPLIDAMRGRVQHVVLIGASADIISAALAGRFPETRASSIEEAVRVGLAIGQRGAVVLLSPACASFDMFDNYEHRGRAFKQAVIQCKTQTGEPWPEH